MPEQSPPNAPLSRDPQGPDASLLDLRRQVLDATQAVVAVVVPGMSVVIIVQHALASRMGPIVLVLSAYTLCFPALWLLRRRLAFRTRAICLLGLLALTAFLIETRGGVAVGSVSLNLLVVLLGALFFGRKGAALGLLAVLVLFAAAAVMVLSNHSPDLDLQMWSPNTPEFWLRESIAVLFFGIAVAVAINFMVERLQREMQELRRVVRRERAANLAREAAEREHELERQRREQTQQALEEAQRIEALARLSGGIAHDFNNALTVVLGAADVAKLSTSQAEKNEQLDLIARAAEGAAELTRQLLTLGRRDVTQPSVIPVAVLLDQISGAFERLLPRDIVLRVSCAPGVNAFADRAGLERALYNLVLNARDAMPRGGSLGVTCVRRRVTNHHALAPGEFALISVADTGVGMDEATRSHIFDPFFTTKQGSGTGLGLATVYSFATAAGGHVSVTSQLEQGARFDLYLPSVDSAPGDAQPVSSTDADGDSALTGRRILIADDEADVRQTLVTALEKHGALVTQASDGESALATMAQANPEFDLLIIDGIMPGWSSAKVIAEARRAYPHTRVLLCSGYVEEELLRRGVVAGETPFLAKPCTARELLAAVQQLLAAPGPRPGSPRRDAQ